MWAQLIKVRMKPGKDTAELNKQVQSRLTESGLALSAWR